MSKNVSVIFKNKDRIISNIKAIRCYLQLTKAEFAVKTGIGDRATEFENDRFRPTMQEIERIAVIAELKPENIIHNVLYQTLQIT